MFFRRIGDLRIDKDKTQKDIADYLHMHLQVYRRYEKGDRMPSMETLSKLADFYHVTVDYKLGRNPEEKIDLPTEQEIDDAIGVASADLTPDEVLRVVDFIAGIKAARRP